LLTFHEKAALKNVVIEKIDSSTSELLKARLRDELVINDSTVRDLLKDGAEVFLASVRHRILQESPGDIFINKCQNCGGLARTPTAKQCPKCFYDWHGSA
jgi:hypothetical protein